MWSTERRNVAVAVSTRRPSRHSSDAARGRLPDHVSDGRVDIRDLTGMDGLSVPCLRPSSVILG